MWNRYFRFLTIKLQIKNRRFFGFPLPIPMYVFQELLDSISDLLAFACLFVPKPTASQINYRPSIHGIRELLQATIILIDSLIDDEPYDLVEVNTKEVKVFVHIK